MSTCAQSPYGWDSSRRARVLLGRGVDYSLLTPNDTSCGLYFAIRPELYNYGSPNDSDHNEQKLSIPIRVYRMVYF